MSSDEIFTFRFTREELEYLAYATELLESHFYEWGGEKEDQNAAEDLRARFKEFSV